MARHQTRSSEGVAGWQSPYAAWSNGPPRRVDFFPILVWQQDPELAEQYRAIGVNTYFGLWQGPTEAQLERLRQAGIYAICRQNDVGLADARRDDSAIIAWMHGDEPDNRRRTPEGGFGGPVPPEKIKRDGDRLRAADPTRPVVVNFGQGVANDAFPGRGATLEQYSEYSLGADIVSYDVYPVANIKMPGPDGQTIVRPDGEEYLWYVAKGVQRLRSFVNDAKPVWNVLECTHIHNPERMATPHQVRAQVWMSLIHGSRGICWFVHDFREGHRNEAALLADDQMRQAVARINHEVLGLAPVLNSPGRPEGVAVGSSDPDVPIASMARQHDGVRYIFAVGMRNRPATAIFRLAGAPAGAVAEVQGEGRSIPLKDESFRDHFQAYDARVYRVVFQTGGVR